MLKMKWRVCQRQRILFAVVKANGYGHGAIETATAAPRRGASGFCVTTVDEGIEVAEAGFSEPILVLGIVSACGISVY